MDRNRPRRLQSDQHLLETLAAKRGRKPTPAMLAGFRAARRHHPDLEE